MLKWLTVCYQINSILCDKNMHKIEIYQKGPVMKNEIVSTGNESSLL